MQCSKAHGEGARIRAKISALSLEPSHRAFHTEDHYQGDLAGLRKTAEEGWAQLRALLAERSPVSLHNLYLHLVGATARKMAAILTEAAERSAQGREDGSGREASAATGPVDTSGLGAPGGSEAAFVGLETKAQLQDRLQALRLRARGAADIFGDSATGSKTNAS